MIKNILTIIFIIIGLIVVINFNDYNLKRAVDACVAGSQKLSKEVDISETKKFCEEKIKLKKKD